jgi:hypothetical protein
VLSLQSHTSQKSSRAKRGCIMSLRCTGIKPINRPAAASSRTIISFTFPRTPTLLSRSISAHHLFLTLRITILDTTGTPKSHFVNPLGHHSPTHRSSPLHPLRSHFSRDPAGGERIPKCDYPVSVCSPEDQWARPNHPRCRSLFSQASGFAQTLCFPGESGPAADSREHLVPCEGDEQLGLDKVDEADPSCGERCPIRPSIHTRRCHQ